jgi:hypothetical protein
MSRYPSFTGLSSMIRCIPAGIEMFFGEEASDQKGRKKIFNCCSILSASEHSQLLKVRNYIEQAISSHEDFKKHISRRTSFFRFTCPAIVALPDQEDHRV